jgi:RNA polymerase sigma-70 factor (ECF subfamily)
MATGRKSLSQGCNNPAVFVINPHKIAVTDTSPPQTPPHAFPHTRWSVVLSANQEETAASDGALETLCRTYWYPLYVCVRRSGHNPHDAQDLTQEFFRRLLEKRWLRTADPAKGRLRTFLITALKRFMANEWRRASAGKRGGGQPCVPMDTAFAESRYATAAPDRCSAEEAFDRQWAVTLLDLTIQRLQAEYAHAGKAAEFEVLKGSLAAAHGAIDYPGVAARLNASQGAARVAVHRLRKRFRELYREEIASTLEAEADVDAELRHLAKVLAS